MLNKVTPIFTNRNNFYKYFWLLLEDIISSKENFIELNKEFNISKKNLSFLYESFKYGIFQDYDEEGHEKFSYVPLNFFIEDEYLFSLQRFNQNYIEIHYKEILRIIYETYYLNQDRLLAKYIDDLILSFKISEMVIDELNEYEKYINQELIDDEIPVLNFFLDKSNSEKQLYELKNYIDEVENNLKNLKISEEFIPFLLLADIELFLYKLESLDHYTKYFCAYFLYFLDEKKKQIFNLLINDLNLGFINEKLLNETQINTAVKLLHKCFISNKNFNIFLINYIKNKEISLSEISYVFHTLKEKKYILPVNEKFFIDELIKYNSHFSTLFEKDYRFYRNTESVKSTYKKKFKDLFGIK